MVFNDLSISSTRPPLANRISDNAIVGQSFMGLALCNVQVSKVKGSTLYMGE